MAKKHRNPYRIQDGSNMFEVTENSSHPESWEKRRIWCFRGYTFRTATELQHYFENEGLNPKRFYYIPKWEQDGDGSTLCRITIAERVSQDEKHLAKEWDDAKAG